MHRRPQVDADNSGEIDLAEFIVFVLTVQKMQVCRSKAGPAALCSPSPVGMADGLCLAFSTWQRRAPPWASVWTSMHGVLPCCRRRCRPSRDAVPALARQAANGLAPAAVAEVASQAKDDSMTDEG